MSQINDSQQSNWSQHSNLSTDLLYKLNILRDSHSPTVTAPVPLVTSPAMKMPTVTFSATAQQPVLSQGVQQPDTLRQPNWFSSLIDAPIPPPLATSQLRIPLLLTSTPTTNQQNVPTTTQAHSQAHSPNKLISNTVSQFQPSAIPADVQDQFHHTVNLANNRDQFHQSILNPSYNRTVTNQPPVNLAENQDQSHQSLLNPNYNGATVQDSDESTLSVPTDRTYLNYNYQQPAEKIVVQFTQKTDTMKNLPKKKLPSAVQQELGSRAILDAMCPLLDKCPTNNSFSECRSFTSDDPPQPVYVLSNNHQTFLNGLLHQLNDHMPPSNLAIRLAPFIAYDTTLGRYRAMDNMLTLDTIQKIDHLINSFNQGISTFQKIKDKIAHHTRSSSK